MLIVLKKEKKNKEKVTKNSVLQYYWKDRFLSIYIKRKKLKKTCQKKTVNACYLSFFF